MSGLAQNTARSLLASVPLKRWKMLFAGLTSLSVIASLLANNPAFMLIPATALGIAVIMLDFSPVYYLLLLATPISIEFAVSDSLSTDLPTEPLMALLMGVFLVYGLVHRKRIDWSFARHPIATVVLLQLAWTVVTLIFSADKTVTLKWIAAKSWYITAFGAITLTIIKNPRDFRKMFWCLFAPTFVLVVISLIRHASYNFGFAEVNLVVEPYFRNHVNYAVFVALITPFLWLAAPWYPKWSYPRMLINFGKPLFLVAVYFSYTRSAWVSLAVGLVAYFAMKRNLLKPSVVIALTALFLTCGWLLQNNRYLDFAPDFSKTIYHDEFSDHMAATTSLEDVSSAERIYRWVAGWYMFLDKPVTGFGPGNFYPYYQNYSVSSFYTYISRNEERSTVHNYYLLVLLEQGFVGAGLFFTLLVVALFSAQNTYNRLRLQGNDTAANLCLAVTISFITILCNNFFNDLIEADKIGTLFYAELALLIALSLWSRQPVKAAQQSS